MRALALTLLLAGCGAGADDASDAAIANRAETLERAAEESTDQMINQIDDQSAADIATDVPTGPVNVTE